MRASSRSTKWGPGPALAGLSNGTSPHDGDGTPNRTDADRDGDGFTELEDWLNSLAR